MNEELNDFDISRIKPETQKKIEKLLAEDSAQLRRNEAYYEKLRKENPRLYRDANTYRQMFDDAKILGDAFFMDTK